MLLHLFPQICKKLFRLFTSSLHLEPAAGPHIFAIRAVQAFLSGIIDISVVQTLVSAYESGSQFDDKTGHGVEGGVLHMKHPKRAANASLCRRGGAWLAVVLVVIEYQVFSLSESRAEGRHSLFMGTQVPLQYTAGYEYRFVDRFSANFQAGILTHPYDEAILGIVQLFGVDDSLRSIIDEAFDLGVIVEGGIKYDFTENNYLGAFGRWVHLEGGGTAAELLGAYFKRDISPLRRSGYRAPLELTLQSDLYLFGILYGRRIRFSNPRFELALEFGVSKSFASTSAFESNRPHLDATDAVRALYAGLSKDMKSAYREYVYVPTINFFLVWKPR